MPGTIKTLSLLFTEYPIECAKQEQIPKDNIYACLTWFYHQHLIPALNECTQNETDDWKTIANATKERATQFINFSFQDKSPSELLQIIRFQRALLGKEPYLFKLTDSLTVSSSASIIMESQVDIDDRELNQNRFHTLKQPLIVFLKEIKKNQSTHFLSSSSSSISRDELHAFELLPYWLSYSLLFKKLGQNHNQLLSKEEILEMLTAMIIEEPEKFRDKALISSLICLADDEIILLFRRKKLSQPDFKIVVEAIFIDSAPPQKQFIEILSCQPQTFAYCYQNNYSVWNACLAKLTSKEIVDIITQRGINYSGHPVYLYSEQEFYDAFVLIIQNNDEFINSLSNEALVKLLCRLEFSTSQYGREKNRRSEDIFETIKNSQKILEFGNNDWLDLLMNADPTVIAKILAIPTPEKKSFFEPFVATEATILISTIQQLTPEVFNKISKEMVSVIYPHFRLRALKNEEKANLITALANNLTEKSVAYCIGIISDTNFVLDNIVFLAKNLPKYNDKSTCLIQTLFKNHYQKLYSEELKSLCQLDIEVVMALLTHKNKAVKEHVFDKLTITDFAEIAATKNYQHDVKRLLEIGLLEKIKREKIKFKDITLHGSKTNISQSDEISNALSILLNVENGAKNTDIFNFIYNNETIELSDDIKKEHLIKSLSYPLDSEDNKLKSNVVNISSFSLLKKKDIFKIFLDARNNHYTSLPKVIKASLTHLRLKHSENLLEELDLFLDKNKTNYPLEVINNTRYEFILEVHKADNELFSQLDYLAKSLKGPRSMLIKIIKNQLHNDHLISFLKDKKIASFLQPEDIIKLFSIEVKENITLPTEIRKKLVSQLLKCNGNLSTQLEDLFNAIRHIAEKREQNKEDHQFEKATSNLLITICQQVHQKDAIKHREFIDFLDENNLRFLVKHQSQHPQLIKLFQDPQLLKKLRPEIASALLAANPLLPTPVSKALITYLFGKPERSLETIISREDNSKTRSALLLTRFLQNSADATQVIHYFSKNPQEIAAILLDGVNQPNVNLNCANLLKLFQHSDILKILTLPQNRACLITAFLNLAQSELNPENQLLIANTLIPFLSKKAIMQIFAGLALNGCILDIEVQKRLVERLDFKRLRQLVENSTKKDKGNIFDTKTLKMTLDNIFFSQIQRQKAFFSIPAFILSLLYGILYYPTLGWLLHFLAPKTSPLYLYKALKKFFHPLEIARIKQKTFEQKNPLAKIADDQLLGKKENLPDEIIMEHTSNDKLELSFFDYETGEIKPFNSQKESYIYLFPGEKERFKLKSEAIEKTIKTIKKQDGVFLTDKNKYFKGEEEKQVMLPEKEEQQLRQRIEDSKEQSRQTYK